MGRRGTHPQHARILVDDLRMVRGEKVSSASREGGPERGTYAAGLVLRERVRSGGVSASSAVQESATSSRKSWHWRA